MADFLIQIYNVSLLLRLKHFAFCEIVKPVKYEQMSLVLRLKSLISRKIT